MRTFFQKYETAFIGLLLFLTVLLRYPITPHEIGVDSFLIHQITNSITEFGTISWALNPMSLFGLYPLSYPSGLPTMLSMISQLAGIDTESAILITCYILAILGTIAVYIMVKKITNDVRISLLSAFFFSIAPVFIELTTWTATTRNLFIALLPLLFWALFSYTQTKSRINFQLLICCIILLTLFTAHRMYFLLGLLFIAYLVTIIIWNVKEIRIIKEKISIISQKTFLLICTGAFLILFSLQFTGLPLFGNIVSFYQAGALAQGTSPPVMILNFIANYCGQVGLFFPLSALGMGLLLLKDEKTFNDMLIIITIFSSASFLFLKYYMPIFLLPFFSFFIALVVIYIYEWLENFCKKNICFSICSTGKILSAFLAILLVVSLVFSLYMVQRHLFMPADENDNKEWLTEETYSIGSFLKTTGEKNFSSPDSLTSARISASTGVGSEGGFLNAYDLGSGIIDKDTIQIAPIPLNKLSIESNGLFELKAFPPVKKDGDLTDILLINNEKETTNGTYPVIYDNGITSIVVTGSPPS